MAPRVPQPEPGRAAGAVRRFGGLQSRIILFIAGLLVAVLGSVLLVVNAVNSRNARAGIDEDLAVGKRVFKHLLEQNNRQLTQAADIISLSGRPSRRAICRLPNRSSPTTARASMPIW
jgi:hypothetical protein